MASSKFSNVDEYGFERHEDFDVVSYENFMSKYLTVLSKRSMKWNRLLRQKKFSKNMNSRKIRRYIRKGIPNEHRPKMWLLCSGAEEAKEKQGHDLYSKLLNQSPDPGLSEIIKIDIPRTFPENIFFSNSDMYQQQLYRILLAYGMHNKGVGYCQGMNYVAGTLLLVTKNEETTFWLLKMLVENILPDYYSPTMAGLITDIDVIAELIRRKHADVHNHFNNLGLPWPIVISKWFICLYCDVLPIETVLRIWDCVFHEGSRILFQVALTIVSKHKEVLIRHDQFTDLVNYVKDCTKDDFTLNCHTFMQQVFKPSSRVPEKDLSSLRETIRKQNLSKKKS